ncbi:MAG: plasmid pRiA4b ORF-3 family protein [Desulfomonilaceae bacterium]
MAQKPKNVSITPAGPSNLVYQMKITLKEVKPPIWRRIQVKGNTTLHALHRTIQTVMGWSDSHLHEFNIFGVSYGDPEQEVGSDEKRVRLNKLDLEEQDKFAYIYDFGDDWEHQIVIEKILPIDEKTQYPICLTGKRSCPPEDCGGSTGYMDLLDVLDDPNDPEYEERIEWIGEDFDSEMFDIEQINRRLKGTRR